MEDQMSNEPQSPEAELARLADGSLPEHAGGRVARRGREIAAARAGAR